MGKWGTAFDIVRDVIVPNRRFLTVYERDVLFFIFARTRMFGREWERISLNQFMHGYCGDNYNIDGVDMSAPKFLESLKHLKEKGFIETRATGIHTANQYRVREQEELDLQHIEIYVIRNQPKLQARFKHRAQYVPNVRRQLEGEKLRTIREFMSEGTPKNCGTLPQNNGVPLPQNFGVCNIPTKKQPIITPSPKTATRGFRHIKLTK